LLRAAGPVRRDDSPLRSLVRQVAQERGLRSEQVEDALLIVERLFELPEPQREAIASLILSMARNSET
jgi:hypothetical protein